MKNNADVVVIGSGPGGYVSAIRAAQLGNNVIIIEADKIGGVCLNVGCIPSKALITAAHNYQTSLHSSYMGITNKETSIDFGKLQDWKDNQVVKKLTSGVSQLLKKNNIEVIKGYAKFKNEKEVTITKSNGSNETIYFKNVIIATGSRPIEIPNFQYSDRILDSTGGLNLAELPKSLSIIGGGYIGCELAGAYADLGVKVTLIEGSSQILPNFDKDISTIVDKSLKGKGIDVITSSQAKSCEELANKVKINIETKQGIKMIESEYLMVTVGRKPNADNLNLADLGVKLNSQGYIITNDKLQTSIPHIYAIGDTVVGPALAHKASYEGKIAAEVISGINVASDYRCIPAICFTDPEVAMVGLSVAEANDKKLEIESSQFPFQANGRAITLNQTEGFVRLVYMKESKELVGAQVVGPNASDLIAELTMAIENFLTIEDISLIIHGHPTLSESIMDASDIGLGMPIHM